MRKSFSNSYNFNVSKRNCFIIRSADETAVIIEPKRESVVYADKISSAPEKM